MEISQEIEFRETLMRHASSVLKAFLFGAHSTIYVSGRLDSTVVLANEAFLAAIGVTRAQLSERPLIEFMSTRDRIVFQAVLQLREPCPPPILLEWATPDGTRRSYFCIVGVQEDTFTLIGECTAPIDPSVQATLFDLNNQLIVSNRALVQQKRELEARTESLAQLELEPRRDDRRDPLTGLFTGRHLLEVFGTEIARAKRGLQRLSVLLIDVDHFRHVNEQFGDATGDQVLAAVSERFAGSLRPYDTIARRDGDEFAVVLPSAGIAQGEVVAERLRAAVVALAQAKGLPPVTVSVGVAEWQEGEGALAVLARADGALFIAKSSGRNRVAVGT